MDNNVLVGSPYLSDYLMNDFFSDPIHFSLAPGINAIGGEWFHMGLPSFVWHGYFALTLASGDVVELVAMDICEVVDPVRMLSTSALCT